MSEWMDGWMDGWMDVGYSVAAVDAFDYLLLWLLHIGRNMNVVIR
jgi:hypothetical protein